MNDKIKITQDDVRNLASWLDRLKAKDVHVSDTIELIVEHNGIGQIITAYVTERGNNKSGYFCEISGSENW